MKAYFQKIWKSGIDLVCTKKLQFSLNSKKNEIMLENHIFGKYTFKKYDFPAFIDCYNEHIDMKKSHPAQWEALVQQLHEQKSISRTSLSKLIAEHLDVTTDHAIRKLRREGIIKRTDGIYIVTSQHTSDEIFIRDPIMAIRVKYGNEVLFCYGTALDIQNLSRYGRLTDYYIAVQSPKNIDSLGQIRVQPVKTPLENTMGAEIIDIAGQQVFVTDVERTIIDCIHRPKYAQGWENIFHAIARIERLREDRVSQYLKLYRLPSLVAKVCLILDRFSEDLGISQDALDRLRPYLPSSPIHLEKSKPSILNKKWNVYVPKDLITDQEEV